MKRRNNSISDDIALWAVNAISGAVTKNMRMIAFGYSENHATFRFYLENEPSEVEREIGEVVAVNFESGLSHRLDALNLEFVVSDEPQGKLDVLDLGLFRRYED